ncbi:hypothetical protein OROMI_003308 [Orobanche minor]
MEDESSNREHRQSDWHRDGESSRSHNHSHQSKQDDNRLRPDNHNHRHPEGSNDRDARRDRERSHSVKRNRRKESEEMSHSAERNKRKDMWGNEEISDKRARFFEENGNGRRRFEDANRLVLLLMALQLNQLLCCPERQSRLLYLIYILLLLSTDGITTSDTGKNGGWTLVGSCLSDLRYLDSGIETKGHKDELNLLLLSVTSKIIIDVEDDDDDVMVLDGDVGTSAKGKESISGFPVVINSITSGSSSLYVGPANNQNSPSPMVTPQKIIIDIDVEEEDDDYEVR